MVQVDRKGTPKIFPPTVPRSKEAGINSFFQAAPSASMASVRSYAAPKALKPPKRSNQQQVTSGASPDANAVCKVFVKTSQVITVVSISISGFDFSKSSTIWLNCVSYSGQSCIKRSVTFSPAVAASVSFAVVSAGLAASVTAAVVSAGVCLLPPQPANETAITPARDAATMLLTIFFIKTLLFLFILQL